jgi:hypothetical protein
MPPPLASFEGFKSRILTDDLRADFADFFFAGILVSFLLVGLFVNRGAGLDRIAVFSLVCLAGAAVNLRFVQVQVTRRGASDRACAAPSVLRGFQVADFNSFFLFVCCHLSSLSFCWLFG